MYKIWFERALPGEHAHLIAGLAELLGPSTATPAEPLCAIGPAQAIVASARIRYDGALMDRCAQLRVIARTGVGYDNIHVADATARGIAVCYTPDAPTISTAEHAFALLLATVKHLKACDRALRKGGKVDYLNDYRGLELNGRRLGLVGMGRIGSRVARMAQAMGMSVMVYDPFLPAQRAADCGVEVAARLEELLAQADVVSLHLPLTAETRRLINRERLAQMKRGGYLVNAARGGLVDEAALLEALASGQLQGAGLDVFDPEPPPPDHPLLDRDDCIATPHIGSATAEGRRRLWEGAISQALDVLGGRRPAHLLNPEVWR
ncbi:MAG: NAD(P)-dependent oxidoreductase [Pirellulales bacterium]